MRRPLRKKPQSHTWRSDPHCLHEYLDRARVGGSRQLPGPALPPARCKQTREGSEIQKMGPMLESQTQH